MSTSYIRYKEYGFWAEDSDMQILSGLLYYTYALKPLNYEPLTEFSSHLKLVSLGYFNSYIHFDFDLLFQDKIKFDSLKFLLNDTGLLIVKYKCDRINLSFLNDVVFDEHNFDIWNVTVAKVDLFELIEKFESVIKYHEQL